MRNTTKTNTLLLMSVILATVLGGISAGRIIYVDGDGPAYFDNIQAAIDDSNDGDTIIVSPGTYTGDGNRDISFYGKAITVRSEDPNDPNIVAATIINCNGTEDQPHRGFLFNSGEEANSVLAGLTITNGYADYGGGIYCEASRPTITSCMISGNSAQYEGGGISFLPPLTPLPPPPPPPPGSHSEQSSPEVLSDDNLLGPMITDCILSDNSALWGGGMFVENSNPILVNCIFRGNSADEGGGIYITDSNTTLTDCIFSGNSARYFGGGISNDEFSHTILTNCTFTGNSVSYVGIMWGDGGGICNFSCNSRLTNCTFNKNSANWGGGIFNIRNSNISLIECIFSENSASRGGGGLYNAEDSNTTLTECIFIKNSAGGGGGLSNVLNRKMTLTKCVFSENSANTGGGMVNFFSYSTLTNCVFSGNLAEEKGGGMYNVESSPILKNCTLSSNWAGTYGGGIYNFASDANLINCILWGDSAAQGNEIYLGRYIDFQGTVHPSTMGANYCNVGGWDTNIYVDADCTLNWGPGNIDADPCFVEMGYWDVNGIWIEGDYHLLLDSPCMDAGDPNYIAGPNETDLDGNPRVIGGRIDMGAYEFQNTPPVADAGLDRTVEAKAPWGATVTLDGSGSSDADSTPGTNDDIVYFDWYKVDPCDPNADVFLGSGRILDCNLPIGEHIILLEVIDKAGAFDTNEVTIIVQDTTPPQFQLSVTPTMLWPPDHKMVLITPSWTVSDDCDPSPDVSLVGIVANEGDNTIGDGHTSNDIQMGEDGSIYLRSERSGTGTDRVYTITYQAVDDCGNTTVRSATVSIPHDFKVLARIAARWLWTNPTARIPEDLNDDGFVNLADFARFAENWIK